MNSEKKRKPILRIGKNTTGSSLIEFARKNAIGYGETIIISIREGKNRRLRKVKLGSIRWNQQTSPDWDSYEIVNIYKIQSPTNRYMDEDFAEFSHLEEFLQSYFFPKKSLA